MFISPSVILQNIPTFLWQQDKTATAIYILGSKTGSEVGVCFWKLHPMHPSFMVVFKYQTDRDFWCKSSLRLKELEYQGVSVSLAWYSRDNNTVYSESEGKTLCEKQSKKRSNSSSLPTKGTFSYGGDDNIELTMLDSRGLDASIEKQLTQSFSVTTGPFQSKTPVTLNGEDSSAESRISEPVIKILKRTESGSRAVKIGNNDEITTLDISEHGSSTSERLSFQPSTVVVTHPYQPEAPFTQDGANFRTQSRPTETVIKIMKRTESDTIMPPNEHSKPKIEQKSLQQREQEYAEARQRILGGGDVSIPTKPMT